MIFVQPASNGGTAIATPVTSINNERPKGGNLLEFERVVGMNEKQLSPSQVVCLAEFCHFSHTSRGRLSCAMPHAELRSQNVFKVMPNFL